MDDMWNDDERGAVFLFPMAVLSGEADLVGEEDNDGRIIEDPAPQLQDPQEPLGATAVLDVRLTIRVDTREEEACLFTDERRNVSGDRRLPATPCSMRA